MRNKIITWIRNKPANSLVLVFVFLATSLILLEWKFRFDKSLNDFAMSFSASLLEDLIFFLFIGIVLYIVTIKKPEDNDIDVRLDTVINSGNVTSKTKNYFRTTTKEKLAFYDSCDVKIKLREHRKKDKAVKLYYNFKANLTNMCKDIDYDVITNAWAEGKYEIDKKWGEVTVFYIKDLISGKNTESILGEPLELPKSGFTKTVPLTITADGKAEYRFAFWVWYKYGAGTTSFRVSIDRFSSSYSLIVENDLEDNLLLPLNSNLYKLDDIGNLNKSPNTKTIKLNSGEQKTLYEDISFKPREIIKINFQEPKNNHAFIKEENHVSKTINGH